MGRLLPKYVLASVAVSLGGVINGYDTGSVGAVMEMDQFTKTMGHLSPFLVGFSVSLIMLTGAVPSVFGGQLADSLGRLKVITLGAVLFGIGAAIEGSASSLVQFLAGRAIAGFGQGVFLSNVSVYICEIAPVKHRGILAGLPQFMATAGICVGYFTCYGTVSIQSGMAWRIPYIIQCIISALFVAGCMIIPDSPRWLMLHGRRQDALVALDWLDFSMVEAERDFLTATEQRSSLSLWQNLVLLFRRGYRSRTILALFVLGMVQLSGIDGVLYVSAFPPNLQLCTDSMVVCACSLFASRTFVFDGLVPRFGCLGHSDARNLDSGFPSRRQVGKTDFCDHRWSRPRQSHVADRFAVCRRRGPSLWSRPMGRHRVRLCVRPDLLRDVGDCRQDLRERDPAFEHKGSRKLGGARPRFRE